MPAPHISTLPATHARPPLRVVISLDVEEEGLFSGCYASRDCGVRNVELLRKLVSGAP